MKKCWVNLRLNQEKRQFFGINKTWKIINSSTRGRSHRNPNLTLHVGMFVTWRDISRKRKPQRFRCHETIKVGVFFQNRSS